MVGYKYGLWLVYNQNTFNTAHIGHFTVQCFMNKEDAFKLYDKINNNYGNTFPIHVEKLGSLFNTDFYNHDKNNLHAWGYYGSIKNWELLQNAAKEYSGDFSYKPHTSIIYSNDKSLLTPINLENDITIVGNLKVVNINAADPSNWSLLN